MWENHRVQLIKTVNAGVQPSHCRVTTRNSKYFAYSAFLAVYVIDQKNFKIVNMISYNDSTVSTLALCNKEPDLIAISFDSGETQVINLIRNQKIFSFTTPDILVSLCWSNRYNVLVGYSKMYNTAYTANLDEASGRKDVKGSFPNQRTIATFESNGPIFVGGNDIGQFSRFDYTHSAVKTYSPTISSAKICAVDVDPASNSVICVWRDGNWALFDATKELTLMNRNEKLTSPFGAGCWVSEPPGHFITGDSSSGVIRLWNSSSTNPIESMTIHTAGVLALNRLNGTNVLCGFTDGMIAVLDMKTKKLIWKTNAAHRNTIFSLEFHPGQPDYLVSCGAEGSICTWDITTMKLVDRVSPKKGLGTIFSMAVTPGGGFIVCGFMQGEIGVFSSKLMSIVYTDKILNSKVVHLSFSAADPNLILVGSVEGAVVIYNLQDRKVVREFRGQQYKYIGCQFSTLEPAKYAITRTDGFVEIYDSINGRPIRVIDVGKFVLYGVSWSPHDKNHLAVTADSGEAIFIVLKEGDYKISYIHKHVGVARPIAFHPTLKNILATSGHDGKIAIFDTDTCSAINVFQAHTSYCYGLTFSPTNPYLLLSSGCDTTIKVWSIDRIMIKKQIDDVLNRRIVLRPLIGQKDLVKLAKRVSRSAEEKLTFAANDIIHINDVVRINDKLVRKMTSTSPTEGSRIKQAIKQKERYLQAAELMLKMGNIKKYCEFMFNAGEHMKAVAAAPGVSVKFWKAMVEACAEVSEDQNQQVALNLAIGETGKAINILKENEKADDALLVTCAAANGLFKFSETEPNKVEIQTEKLPYESIFKDEKRLFEYSIGSKRSMNDLVNDKVYLAAADLLSVGDVDKALELLLINGELLAAETINVIFESPNDHVTDMFALLCINNGITKECFDFIGPKCTERVITSVIFNDDIARDEMYKQVGLKSIEEYTNEPEPATVSAKIHRLLLIGKVIEAVDIGIDYLKENLVKPEFDWVEARAVCREFEYSSLVGITDDMKNQVASCSLIVAAYESMWKGFKKAFMRCFKILRNNVQEESMQWAASLIEQFQSYMKLFPPEPYITIKAAGADLINPSFVGEPVDEELKYGALVELDDLTTKLSLQTLLEWQQLTLFSPLGNDTKYILY